MVLDFSKSSTTNLSDKSNIDKPDIEAKSVKGADLPETPSSKKSIFIAAGVPGFIFSLEGKKWPYVIFIYLIQLLRSFREQLIICKLILVKL